MSLLFVYIYRAQKRVAQQRIDSRMPLGRIIDIRKKVFAEVKVCHYFAPVFFSLIRYCRNIVILGHKSATSGPYRKFDLLQTVTFLLPEVGQGP
jgi:hypothetical protein